MAGAVLGVAIAPRHAAPVIVPVIATPAPVTITPAPVVVTPAVAPVPTLEVPPAPAPPPPRATTPLLNAGCLVAPEGAASPSCAWDDGLPAISADGTRVATRFVPDDGGRGYPGLSIRLIDVRTSRLVRDLLVLSPDEYDPDGGDDRLRVRVERRAAGVQRLLDAGGYRTLEHLGTQTQDLEPTVDRTRVHAELDGDRVRAIDPATSRVLWQHRFAAPGPRRTNPDFDCGGWGLHHTSVWWDPATRVVLVAQAYATGGCMCAVIQVEHVRRMPMATPAR